MRAIAGSLLASLTLGPVSSLSLAEDTLPDPVAAGWKGEQVCEILQEDATHRMLRCIFPPGVGHERHYHAPHVGYVITGGRMRIVDADGAREVDLSNGGTWTSDGVGWHEVLNVGDQTSRFLIIEIKGGGGRED